jgi:curved DNA-binding protein CbpA
MPVGSVDITDLKQAYQVLGLPTSASPHAIKQAYRRMARRWHPDLFKSGTSEHAEATLMMKIINDAFAKVERAPLRGSIEPIESEGVRPKKQWTVMVDSEGFPMGDRGDFWIRFFYGACFRSIGRSGLGCDAALSPTSVDGSGSRGGGCIVWVLRRAIRRPVLA